MNLSKQSVTKKDITDLQLQEWLNIQQGLSSTGVDELKELYQFEELVCLIDNIEQVLDSKDSLLDVGESLKKLTFYEHHRWKDCMVSIKHCRLMVNCLHSVPLNYFSPLEWNQHCNELKATEILGSRILMNLQESKCQLHRIIETPCQMASTLKKSTLIQYLRWLVELLKVEYQIYKHEVEIGNLFEQKSQTYFNLVMQKIELQSTSFQLDMVALNKVYQTLCHDQKNPQNLEHSLELNQKILFETKKSLNHAVQQLKSKLRTRHQKFKSLFESILGIETCLSVMQDQA